VAPFRSFEPLALNGRAIRHERRLAENARCVASAPDVRRPQAELRAKEIAEMGRTAESHRIGDFRDR
jgi:hypothetical protein